MFLPSAMPPTTPSGARIGLGVGLLGYAVVLFILIGAVPGGSDNSGYFNEARLLARGQMHAPMRTLAGVPAAEAPYLYIPLGFKPAAGADAEMVPTYPPGLPLLLIPASYVAGWGHAGDLVLLIHSLAGLALVFALGRACGLPGAWSLAGAAILAASPLYLFTSLQALSDVPAAAWATAAVVAALRSREKTCWALVSGLCISVGFLIRPNNFLIAIPVVIAMGLSPRRLALVAAGSLPGILAFMAVNHAAYGGSLHVGYGAIGNEFHAALIPGTLGFYVRWLPLLLSPVVLFAPSVLALLKRAPRLTCVLASWALAYGAFFSAYRWTHEQWWFLRFLLPAAPALIVSGLLVPYLWLEWVKGHQPKALARLIPVLLIAPCICVELGQSGPLAEARAIGHGERKYGRVSSWLSDHAPRDSAVVVSQASGALFYFTPFTLLRYEEISPSIAQRAESTLQSEGRPLYAVLFPFEEGALKRLPGRWDHLASIDDVSIWRCEIPTPAK
jgi:hypothetical protein